MPCFDNCCCNYIKNNLFPLFQSEVDLQVVRQNYIVGATFGGNETTPIIKGWFNNLPYHSIPLAVGTIYNTLLRKFTKNTTITVINYPLPFTEDTVVINLI
jgi:hypothetical protein